MRNQPRAVIVPFGVPAEGQGLGLGLAALAHSFMQIDGQNIALAQLLARKTDDPKSTPLPVEAFVPPPAWKDLAGNGNAPPEVVVVVTGSFEPPSEGRGHLQLLAFDPRDGSPRARVETHINPLGAGETIVGAFNDLWQSVGGELGAARGLGALDWESLESVIRAERCALHDPLRGGPHDRLAAMAHLGRAIADAPDALFPASRLAALAMESAAATPANGRLAEAALRALKRAATDAPAQLDLVEAASALHVRAGEFLDGEVLAQSGLRIAPKRARLHALLSEARRGRGDLDGALAAVDAGLTLLGPNTALFLERGLVLAERGDLIGADALWRMVLAEDGVNPVAFLSASALTLRRQDEAGAQILVDQALGAPVVHPDVLRRAIQLALIESPGLARGARIAKLAEQILAIVPEDRNATLLLARALIEMGEVGSAVEQLKRLENEARETALGAEAQRLRFSATDPSASLEVDAVVRAAHLAPRDDLAAIATRARRLGGAHDVWTAPFACGVAESRLGRHEQAKVAFLECLARSPGCTLALFGLVSACIELGEGRGALEFATRAQALEGDTPRTMGSLAAANFAVGNRKEAEEAIARALLLDPNDAPNQETLKKITAPVVVARDSKTLAARVRAIFGKS